MAIKLPEHDQIQDIVYVECGQVNNANLKCKNRLPLDRHGAFIGRCGRCGKTMSLRFWQLAESQRVYRKRRDEIRAEIKRGNPITLEEFDYVAKDFV